MKDLLAQAERGLIQQGVRACEAKKLIEPVRICLPSRASGRNAASDWPCLLPTACGIASAFP